MTYWDYILMLLQVLTGPVVAVILACVLIGTSLAFAFASLETDRDLPIWSTLVWTGFAIVLIFVGGFIAWTVAEIDPLTYWQPIGAS